MKTKTNMKQILIKFPDDMSDMDALNYVRNVVKMGKVSKNNTLYCYWTQFVDNTCVSVNDRAKHPTFRIWRRKGEQKDETL